MYAGRCGNVQETKTLRVYDKYSNIGLLYYCEYLCVDECLADKAIIVVFSVFDSEWTFGHTRAHTQ